MNNLTYLRYMMCHCPCCDLHSSSWFLNPTFLQRHGTDTRVNVIRPENHVLINVMSMWKSDFNNRQSITRRKLPLHHRAVGASLSTSGDIMICLRKSMISAYQNNKQKAPTSSLVGRWALLTLDQCRVHLIPERWQQSMIRRYSRSQGRVKLSGQSN